jgi:hypothetical protein
VPIRRATGQNVEGVATQNRQVAAGLAGRNRESGTAEDRTDERAADTIWRQYELRTREILRRIEFQYIGRAAFDHIQDIAGGKNDIASGTRSDRGKIDGVADHEAAYDCRWHSRAEDLQRAAACKCDLAADHGA